MAFGNSFNFKLDSLIQELSEQKKKRQNFLQSIKDREMTEKEKQGQFLRDKTASDAIFARGTAAEKSLDRQNDAFEVAAGRQDPNYFRMKWGSNVDSSSGKSLRSTGKSDFYDRDKMLVNAYAERSKLDPSIANEDFISFKQRYDATFPQNQENMGSYDRKYLANRANEYEDINKFNKNVIETRQEVGSENGKPIYKYSDQPFKTVRNKKTGEIKRIFADGREEVISSSGPLSKPFNMSGIDIGKNEKGWGNLSRWPGKTGGEKENILREQKNLYLQRKKAGKNR